MNAIVLAISAITLFILGYRFYGRIIERALGTDPARETPAKTKYDGIDFMPAKNWLVLFGHHFASIAGAAPIIGPVIAAALWGWGPAFLWIVLGSIFFGGAHDFGALIVSVRNNGDSISETASKAISRRAKLLFSSFVWLTLILIVAIFVYFAAKTLSIDARTVFPSIGLIPVAILFGILVYRLNVNQAFSTILCLLLLGGLIVLGLNFPLNLGEKGLEVWIILLLAYCYIASITPVNILLQPRDYLSSYLLFGGMLFGYAGILLTRPVLTIPLYTQWSPGDGQPLWPILFVTVACGAISGFHSLIASGTTSKQIASESHARRIGYGAMIAEGALAVLALLSVAAGLKGQAHLSGLLAKGGPGPIGAFGSGYGNIAMPILGVYGGIFAIMVLNSFIFTTLDSATRIGRYLTQELFGIRNRFVSTAAVIILAGWLALSGSWKKLWVLFGSANQLVAALALIVITSWLLSKRRSIKYFILPTIFMLITTVGALFLQLFEYINEGNYLLMAVTTVLIGLSLVMAFEAVRSFRLSKEHR